MIYIALLIALLFPGLALAVPTEHYGAAASITGGPVSFTIPLDLTGCVNCFIVAGCVQTTSGVSNMVGVTWNGSENFTPEVNIHDGDSTRLSLWTLVNPTAGFFDVEITEDNGVSLSCGAIGYSGVNQATPYGTIFIANDATFPSSTGPSVNVTGVTADNLVVDFVAWYGGPATVTPGGGQTLIIHEGSTDGTITASTEPGIAGTITMSWGINGHAWIQAGLSLRPAAAAPSTARRRTVIVQ